MSDPEILSRLIVVLWRPKSPGNVGSVARAMKNMGVRRLRIADPIRYRDPSFFRTESERMAWDAADILDRREEHPTIEGALADAVLVAGTASSPPDGHVAVSPRDLAPRILEAARSGPVALLLGQEDIGLTREVLARCQVVGSIPSSNAYSSLNLAQAALVFLYEIRLSALAFACAPEPPDAADADGAPAPVPAAPPGQEAPTQADLEGFYGRLTRTLDTIGFFEGSGRPHMVRELRRIFNRALLTRREVMILEGILNRIEWDRSRR